MKKTYILIIATLMISILATAQSGSDSMVSRAQGVFLEVGGASLVIGINYDTRFSNRRNGLGMRLGVGYFGLEDNNLITIPVMLNYLIGKRKNFLELGLGATYVSAKFDFLGLSNKEEYEKIMAISVVGYRYQPLNTGFMFRVGIAPIFRNEVLPAYPYISFGYTF